MLQIALAVLAFLAGAAKVAETIFGIFSRRRIEKAARNEAALEAAMKELKRIEIGEKIESGVDSLDVDDLSKRLRRRTGDTDNH